jgi:hypothetical protein
MLAHDCFQSSHSDIASPSRSFLLLSDLRKCDSVEILSLVFPDLARLLVPHDFSDLSHSSRFPIFMFLFISSFTHSLWRDAFSFLQG